MKVMENLVASSIHRSGGLNEGVSLLANQIALLIHTSTI
jgi:hypothetical protein